MERKYKLRTIKEVAYRFEGDRLKALGLYDEALEAWGYPPLPHWDTDLVHRKIVQLLILKKDWDAAISACQNAIEIHSKENERRIKMFSEKYPESNYNDIADCMSQNIAYKFIDSNGKLHAIGFYQVIWFIEQIAKIEKKMFA